MRASRDQVSQLKQGVAERNHFGRLCLGVQANSLRFQDVGD
jgi:hypothetical protein